MESAGENAPVAERRSLGATLAAERERQGLSCADAAHRLHMSPSQIEALEREDYEHLPRGTFLRGFVRNYAKLLGLAPDSVLSLLAEATPRDPVPGIVVPTQNIRFDPMGDRLSNPYVKAAALAVVAVGIAFAAMYWAMYIRPRPPGAVEHREAAPAAIPAPATQAAAPAVAPAAPEAPPSENPVAVVSPSPASAASTAPAAPDAPPKVAATAPEGARSAPAAKPGGPAKSLHFRFAGESWVEVRDARGKVLLQRLNPAGSEADVSGRPPLQVVVGNAPEVRMSYDGRPFDLEPHTNVAVARFTLE